MHILKKTVAKVFLTSGFILVGKPKGSWFCVQFYVACLGSLRWEGNRKLNCCGCLIEWLFILGHSHSFHILLQLSLNKRQHSFPVLKLINWSLPLKIRPFIYLHKLLRAECFLLQFHRCLSCLRISLEVWLSLVLHLLSLCLIEKDVLCNTYWSILILKV